MVEFNIKDIHLVETDDLRSGRGGGKKGSGEKYGKYVEVIKEKKIGDGFRELIRGSKHGIIRIRTVELAKILGMKMRGHRDDDGLHPTSLFWGFKYALFHDGEVDGKFTPGQGFVVGTGKTKKDEPVLVIRMRKETDKLPASLIEKTAENEVEEEIEKEEEIKEEEIKEKEEEIKEEEIKEKEEEIKEEEKQDN